MKHFIFLDVLSKKRSRFSFVSIVLDASRYDGVDLQGTLLDRVYVRNVIFPRFE